MLGRCASFKILELTYEQLAKHLMGHSAPQANEIAESCTFFTGCHRTDETAKDFIVGIRKRACKRDSGEARDRMLQDRLACELCDVGVQWQLLANSLLTVKEAEEIALAANMAALNVQQIEKTNENGSVHVVGSKENVQPYNHKVHPHSSSRPSEDVCQCCSSTKHKAGRFNLKAYEHELVGMQSQ